MKVSNVSHEGTTKILRFFTAAGILLVLLSFWVIFRPREATTTANAQTSIEPNATPSPASETEQLSPEESRLRENWRLSIAQVPLPKKGCFEATYPSAEWQDVLCTTAPTFPQPPRRGPRPQTVGNSNDVSAQAPFGFISSATGSFDTVSGVTSESGPIANSGPAVANAYTLQLNTNQFPTCVGSPNPACKGWQQFVFANNGSAGLAYIQYWLIKYNKSCPAGGGWTQFQFTGDTDIYCYQNSTAVSVPNQPIGNLKQLSLTGTVGAAGDSITVSTASNAYSTTGNSAVDASGGWRIAEFNIFGDGGNSAGGGQASFNSGSTVIPRTRIIYGGGGTGAPTCVAQGFTAETNNLSFGPTPPAASGSGPALLFSESSGGAAMSNCAAATGVGDTHLTTFNGLMYDFQASGDFVLAEVDPDFVVQTRQVSGAPTWPNASVNSAVATQMGKNKVAICLPGARVNIDGANTDVADGKPFSTADGVDITRKGNIYFISDQSGNSVRATVNPTWIDVSVGLGAWPAKVSGLLANPNGNVNQIATRDGAVLTNPFSFQDLYHRYADSWRVSPKESLLSACSDREIERSVPQRTFYASDLEARVYERTRVVCTAAGVKEGPLLDACILDVAVIGNDDAAKVYVTTPAPAAVGTITDASSRSRLILWLLLGLLLALLIALILWLIKKKKP